MQQMDCSSNEVYIKTENEDRYLAEDAVQDDVYADDPAECFGATESTHPEVAPWNSTKGVWISNSQLNIRRRFIDKHSVAFCGSFIDENLNAGNNYFDEQRNPSSGSVQSKSYYGLYADPSNNFFIASKNGVAQGCDEVLVSKNQRRKRSVIPKILYCYHCQYVTTKRKLLIYHIMSVHTKVRPFSCQHCSFKAVHRGNLNKHITSKHTKEWPFLCPQCEYKTVYRNDLRKHILARHTTEKPFACLHCDFSTADKSSLKNHILNKHTKLRPFSCPHCEYCAVRRNDVKVHILMKHTDSKPFSCPHCAYTTAKKHNLKMHIIYKHTKEKPFPCTICDQRFTRNAELARHINVKH